MNMEIQNKGIKNIFNETVIQNFPHIRSEIDNHMEEAYRTQIDKIRREPLQVIFNQNA